MSGGKRTSRRWTADEDRTIADNGRLGIRVLAGMLPGRTVTAIRQRAVVTHVSLARIPRPTGATRWRGRIPIPDHAHPLVREFVAHANRQRTMLPEIAERSGLSPDTISDWRYRRGPYLPNFIAALNVLGLDLAIVHMRDPS